MSAGRFAARSPFLRGRQSGLESDLINRLRRLPVGPVPDPRFKSDLRAQLVSITARIVAESATTVHEGSRGKTATAPATHAKAAASRRRRGLFAHPGLSLAGLAATLVLLLVTANSIARNALPGDALYGVKRTSENLALSLASGDVAKGKEYLAQATSRAHEASELLARGSSSARITSTLREADEAGRNGAQALAHAAVAAVSVAPLDTLDSWAHQQTATLSSLSTTASAGPVGSSATSSLALLKRIQARSAALRANVGCPCLSAANSDDLGPVPCSPCTPPAKAGQPQLPQPNHLGGQGTTSGGSHGNTVPPVTSVPDLTSQSRGQLGASTSAAPGPSSSGGGLISVPPLTLPSLGLGGVLGTPSPAPDASSSGAVSGLGVLGLLGMN